MTEREVEFWFRLPVELQDAFERFCSAFPVGNYIHDAENVWEWFDGRTVDNSLGFNITRQWEEGSIPDEPIRLSLLIHDDFLTIENIGQRLASALNTEVHTGTVKYIGGDDFEFIVERTFKPPT